MTDKEAMKLALFALDIVKIRYTQSRHVNEAIVALKERLAQPEQEPVAWLCEPDEDGLFGLPLSDKGCKNCFPVYRHPPQRTEPPQKRVWTFWDLSGGDIADAIKTKLKEKNNG
jgi:hypothetical protein